MSFITDVIVVSMYDEDDAIAEVNRHLTSDGDDQLLRLLDMDAAGGRKAITAQVWAASFNYVNEAKLRKALLAAPWRSPGEVMFCVSGENWTERFWPAGPGAAAAEVW